MLVRLRELAPMALALAFAAAMFALAAPHSLGPPWLLGALAALALLWVLLQPSSTTRDDTLPALAILIAALGVLLVARLSPDLAAKQLLWLVFSLVLALVAGPAFTRFRVLSAYTYVWIVVAIVLFFALALFGQEVNGAKLWIRFGGVQFEPVEVIKLLIVLFMASYLAGTADVIERTKPWSLRANAKYLGPLFIGWGASMAILVLERDLGMAMLLLSTFAAMLYVATRRIDLILGCTVIFAGAIWWAATHFHY
ncbi:MAG TPA: FtsW/RodA/SpoVE family cell cycle protein, partial [Candidatus Lustribacter sp.]|nr:FtsW/RodA/SpoVE family cell cycle protein [Candidatus Lustribacter sp.]